MTINTIVERLEACRQTGSDSWQARCPAHEDGSPSLSLKQNSDGRVLVHCHAGCSALDVLDAVGLNYADLFPPDGEYKSLVSQLHRKGSRETIDSLVIEIAEHDQATGKSISSKDRDRYKQALKRNPPTSDAIVEIYYESGELK